MFLKDLPKIDGHKDFLSSGSLISQFIEELNSSFKLFNFKGFNSPIPKADKSLAIPLTPKQSGLLGVIDKSTTFSALFLFYEVTIDGNPISNNDWVGAFNGDIAKWDTSRVTNMNHMFFTADHFNSDIRNWNTSLVANMQSMFNGCTNFDQDLSALNDNKVKIKNRIFM